MRTDAIPDEQAAREALATKAPAIAASYACEPVPGGFHFFPAPDAPSVIGGRGLHWVVTVDGIMASFHPQRGSIEAAFEAVPTRRGKVTI